MRLGFLLITLISFAFAKTEFLSLGDEFGKNWSETTHLIVHIGSADIKLEAVADLAIRIQKERRCGLEKVTVYIDDRAHGGAALLPFIADEILMGEKASWGDLKRASNESHLLVKTTLEPLLRLDQIPLFEQMLEEGVIVGPEAIEPVEIVTRDEFIERYDLGQASEVFTPNQSVGRVFYHDLQNRMRSAIKTQPDEQNLVGYLKLTRDRMIDQTTYIYIKLALEEYRERKVSFVLLDLDTPGGEVFSAMKITRLLREMDAVYDIPVLAFIDSWAVSAGAMLAYACRFIGTVPTSIMGAAEPIQGGERASEKVNSALRAEMSNLSSFYGRDPLIAEAMVDRDMILVLRNHQIVQLGSTSEIISYGPAPDYVLSAPGKLLTLNAQQLLDFGVADFEVPAGQAHTITEEEREVGKWPATKSLVFQQPFLAAIPEPYIISFSNWRTSFYSFLTHPLVASLLFLGLIVGFYIEISTPGFGFAGAASLTSLTLIMISSFAVYTVHWLEVIILCAGFTLLLVELFLIPGFGIAGILGILLMIIGLFALMLPGIGDIDLFDFESFSLISETILQRVAFLAGAVILAVLLLVVLARFIPMKLLARSKLVLKEDEPSLENLPAGKVMPEAGTKGKAYSPLRPAGKIEVGGLIFDGITEGTFIEEGRPLEVVRIEGNKLIVRNVE